MNDATTLDVAKMGRPDISREPLVAGEDATIDRVAVRMTRRAVGSIAAGVGLLLGVCLVVAYLVGRNEQITADIYVLSDIRATTARVLELALDAETGQRGYLVTHSEAYLEPFRRASETILPALDTLADRVTDDPIKTDIVRRLRLSVDQKLGELRQTIELEREGRHQDALAIMNSDVGKRQMDEIRDLGGRLDANLHDLVANALAQQTRTRLFMLAALAIAGTGIVGLSVIMVRDTRKQLRRLNARRSRLRTMVQTLEERVARRTRELTQINQRFDIALEASGIVVFTQDRDLTYTWISHDVPGFPTADAIGRSDQQILPARSLTSIERLKRSVIESGIPARGEVSMELDGSMRWWSLTVVPLLAPDGTVQGVVCGAVDISERKATEAQIRLLMGEVTHRSKNLLSVIQAITRQTAINSASTEDFVRRFTARLNSLAGSHDLLVRENWQGVTLGDLVRSQLGHYSDLVGSHIQIEGGPLMVPPLAAQHIGMALHELATNAAKYGALSTAEGHVHIAWHVTANTNGTRECHLSWSESGGPPVKRPSQRGFGRVVIERTVARALDGKVNLDYAPDGVCWTLSFPLTT